MRRRREEMSQQKPIPHIDEILSHMFLISTHYHS
jgi:hypothetical protein